MKISESDSYGRPHLNNYPLCVCNIKILAPYLYGYWDHTVRQGSGAKEAAVSGERIEG